MMTLYQVIFAMECESMDAEILWWKCYANSISGNTEYPWWEKDQGWSVAAEKKHGMYLDNSAPNWSGVGLDSEASGVVQAAKED